MTHIKRSGVATGRSHVRAYSPSWAAGRPRPACACYKVRPTLFGPPTRVYLPRRRLGGDTPSLVGRKQMRPRCTQPEAMSDSLTAAQAPQADSSVRTGCLALASRRRSLQAGGDARGAPPLCCRDKNAEHSDLLRSQQGRTNTRPANKDVSAVSNDRRYALVGGSKARFALFTRTSR